MTEIRLALDRASVRVTDDDGHMHVMRTPISKANVCPYYGREIPDWQALGLDANKTYKLYRDAAELEKAADSFSGKPLLLGHKPVSAEDHDHDMVVGSVTGAEWDAPYLYARLDIWPGEATKAIESGAHEQLSSAYRYTADMTPGTAPDGTRYDGRMTAISGNHVALVPEGRAGPDVVVADAALRNLKDILMKPKAVPTRAAAMAQGALLTYLRPKMATDAKIDLGSVLKGVSAKTFASQKGSIKVALDAALKGKLAKDADISDVTELLDALEGVIPEEAMDEDDDDKKKVKAADADETEEEKKAREAKEAKEKADKETKDKKAMDEAMKGMVSKSVMDEALASAVKLATDAATRTQREIREAERFVEPWVGRLTMAHDSAPDVYRSALKALNFEGADKLHPEALRPVLQAQPVPGAKPARQAPLGQDAASTKGFAERYPDASRIRAL